MRLPPSEVCPELCGSAAAVPAWQAAAVSGRVPLVEPSPHQQPQLLHGSCCLARKGDCRSFVLSEPLGVLADVGVGREEAQWCETGRLDASVVRQFAHTSC